MADYDNVEETKLQRVKRLAYAYRWLILVWIGLHILGVFMFIHRQEVFEFLEWLSHKIDDMGFK